MTGRYWSFSYSGHSGFLEYAVYFLGRGGKLTLGDRKFSRDIWLVTGPIIMVKAGGREIHPYPAEELHPLGRILTPRSPWKEEYLFRHGINSRKILSREQLNNLRDLFIIRSE